MEDLTDDRVAQDVSIRYALVSFEDGSELRLGHTEYATEAITI
jgi:hypothetical protein